MSAFALQFGATASGPDAFDAAVARARGLLRRRAAFSEQVKRGARYGAYVAQSVARDVVGYADTMGGRVLVLLDGRVDVVTDVTAIVGRSGPSLASRLATAYARDGEKALDRLRGAFAFAIVDERTNEVLLARDCTGTRTLYYRDAEPLCVASEPLAVLALAAARAEEHPPTVAAMLVDLPWVPGTTAFASVREVLPGELVRWSAGRLVRRELGQRPRPQRLHFKRRADAEEAFHAVLERATRRALDYGAKPAIALSGGLQSTAIAAIAAPRTGSGFRSYTWSLPEYADANAEPWVRPTAHALALEPTFVPATELGPTLEPDGSTWTGAPYASADALMTQALLRRAVDDGCDAMLDGRFGDVLHAQPSRWLIDALTDRRYVLAATETARRAATRGPLGLWREPGLRRLARHGLGQPPARRGETGWLRAEMRARLANDRASWPPWQSECRNPEQCGAVLGIDACADPAPEAWLTDPLGIEAVHPYRDAELVELMLGMPAYWMETARERHALSRAVLAGRVPDRVRAQRKPGSLAPFLSDWLRRRHPKRSRALLFDEPRSYERYLDADAVRAAWEQADGGADRLLWSAIGYELWRRAVQSAVSW